MFESKAENIKIRQMTKGRGSMQALHKETAPLKPESWAVPMKSFHFNGYTTSAMTKLLSKKSLLHVPEFPYTIISFLQYLFFICPQNTSILIC